MFTIIIPFLNRVNLLKQTINCIIDQTFKEWECILVDDGSSDLEREEVLRFIDSDERIVYFRRPSNIESGGNGARNYGLEHARYDFIIFYDSDDLMINSALENRAAIIDSGLNYDYWVFPTGTFQGSLDGSQKSYELPANFKEGISQILKLEVPWQTGSFVWKKDFFYEIGCWDQALKCFQDYELIIRAVGLSKRGKIVKHNPCTHFYRFHSIDSISSGLKRIQHKKYAFDASKKIELFIPNEMKFEFEHFIKTFFIYWSILHISWYTPVKILFWSPFFKTISRLKFIFWISKIYTIRISIFIHSKVLNFNGNSKS